MGQRINVEKAIRKLREVEKAGGTFIAGQCDLKRGSLGYRPPAPEARHGHGRQRR